MSSRVRLDDYTHKCSVKEEEATNGRRQNPAAKESADLVSADVYFTPRSFQQSVIMLLS